MSTEDDASFNASSDNELVGIAALGTRKKPTDVKRMQFVIHEFEQLPEKRGEAITTPCVKAHGYRWYLIIFPRGNENSSKKTEQVSVHLWENTASPVLARWAYKVGPGRIHREFAGIYRNIHFDPIGRSIFLQRSMLLNPEHRLLDVRSLVIDVWIQVQANQPEVWYPQLPRKSALLQRLLLSEERSDGAFLIEEELFPVHKCVLAVRAKGLLDLLLDDEEEVTPVKLDGVNAAAFRALLLFVYTGAAPNHLENISNARSLLQASDMYGITLLKLHVESVIVDKFLDETNAAELLMFAESHSCALLKEYAIDLCLSEPTKVRASEAWAMVEDSPTLLSDLLTQSSAQNQGDQERVADLRNRIFKQGLDVDGSRRMLVKRLEDNDPLRSI